MQKATKMDGFLHFCGLIRLLISRGEAANQSSMIVFVLIAASSFFSHLKTIDSLFSVGLTYDLQICSAYKSPHFYVLPNEVINALYYCKLDFIRRKL